MKPLKRIFRKPREDILDDEMHNVSLWERWIGSSLWRRCTKLWCIANANPFPWQMVLIVVYRLILDTVYIMSVSPVYAYSGFTIEIEPIRYVVSLLTVVSFSPFVARLIEDSRPSSIICSFLNSIYFIPLTSYFGCHGAQWSFYVTAVVYWGLLLVFQHYIPSPVLKAPNKINTAVLMKGLTVVSVLSVFFVSGSYTGFRLTLDLVNVYGIRSEASEYSMPTVLSYAISMMPIILALLMAWWLERKKYVVVAVLIVTYLFLFSIAAHKTIFFLLIVILLIWFFYRPWMMRWNMGLLSLLACGCSLFYLILGNHLPIGLLIRRVMYLPIQISSQRFEMFQTLPVSLFRDSLLGKFSFEPLYSTTIARLTGEFRNNALENASNGLLGDMFANMPIFPGVILMPLILVLCFRLLDMSADNARKDVVVAVCIMFSINFTNSSWSTILLTHGFLVACLLLYLFFNKNKGELL